MSQYKSTSPESGADTVILDECVPSTLRQPELEFSGLVATRDEAEVIERIGAVPHEFQQQSSPDDPPMGFYL
jgi:hypothetical protein